MNGLSTNQSNAVHKQVYHIHICMVTLTRALTCLILLSVPCVPGAHKLTRVFRVSMNGRQDVLTKDTHKDLQNLCLWRASEWRQWRKRDFLPKFIISIEALRLHIVNCKETTKHEWILTQDCTRRKMFLNPSWNDETHSVGVVSHLNHHNTCSKSQKIHTLYFVQVVVFLLGKQMRVSIFSGVNLSYKQRLEPAVFTVTREAPVMKRNTNVGYNRHFICYTMKK